MVQSGIKCAEEDIVYSEREARKDEDTPWHDPLKLGAEHLSTSTINTES